MRSLWTSATLVLGFIMTATEALPAQVPDAATDPRIDPHIRPLLAELNKDPSPFWELPQPTDPCPLQ